MADWTADHKLEPPKDKRAFVLAAEVGIAWRGRPACRFSGEKVHVDGKRESRYSGDTVSVLIATSKDTTAELLMPLEDAIAVGLVEPRE